jgi:hypothetical protein
MSWGWECGGFPTRAFTTLSWWLQSTGPHWNFQPKKCMNEAGPEFPLFSTLHPPNHLYLTEPSWKHILFSLVLWSWLMSESQGQVIPPNSWNSAQGPGSDWARGPSTLALACPCCCLIWINICLRLIHPLPLLALRISLSLCPDMGLEWAESDRQEEWCHLAWSTYSVGKYNPSCL